MATIKVTRTDGQWKIGTIDGIKFNAKVYEEPSEFGINGGNVSKLWIDGIANYDRGWDLRAKTVEGKAMVKELIKYFKNPENCKLNKQHKPSARAVLLFQNGGMNGNIRTQ